jgi:hypothetical protein
MTGARFVADILASGKVFGFSPGATRSEIEAGIGDDAVAHLHGKKRANQHLRLDYGLAEFTFARESGELWVCEWITVRIDRLSDASPVLDEARRVWGIECGPAIAWREVAAVLASENPQIVVLGPIAGVGVNEFQIPETGCRVTVFTENEPRSSSGIAAGDVNTIIVGKAQTPG